MIRFRGRKRARPRGAGAGQSSDPRAHLAVRLLICRLIVPSTSRRKSPPAMWTCRRKVIIPVPVKTKSLNRDKTLDALLLSPCVKTYEVQYIYSICNEPLIVPTTFQKEIDTKIVDY